MPQRLTQTHRKKRTPQRASDFARRILGLISDTAFIKFINISSEPNFFSIVGRTHYERWHSCFLGWLLDPNGSHLLSDYMLKRFLLLLLDDSTLEPDNNVCSVLIDVLPTVEFDDIQVTPNEFITSETSVKDVGRFDIFLTGQITNNLCGFKRINVIFELKIDSKIKAEQSKNYADWLTANHHKDLNILIYLLPNLLSSSKATVGDSKWFCIDYQTLHDKLLVPILDHPNLNENVKPFIIQYIKNLKKRHRGIKMAITNEEKELALTLYRKYGDVFDSIFDALQSTNTIDYNVSDAPVSKGRAIGRIAVKVDKRVFVGKDVKELFKNVLKYMVDKNYVIRIPLPWGTGTKRYIISNEKTPVHPNGREFFVPVRYRAYTLESHYARERAIKVLDDLCNKLRLDFELVEV